jgi:anti-sigma factor ChrR (cupin superfamily)
VTHVRLSNADQERLALYALSALDPADARTLEAHLGEGCATCRAELASFHAVAADLPLGALPRAPSPALRERVLAGARGRGGDPPSFYFLLSDERGWKEIVPGVERRTLAGDVYLIRMAAGASAPTHRHSRVEDCYVIEGDLMIAGHRLRSGDYHRAEVDTVHDRARSDGGALLLILESPA